MAAGWSPISPNRTLGRRCRFWANWGNWWSVEGKAVVVGIAVVAVVVAVVFIGWVIAVVVTVGPAVIGASSGCSSAAMGVKRATKSTESVRRIRDLLVLDKHLCRNLHRWIRISVLNLSNHS